MEAESGGEIRCLLKPLSSGSLTSPRLHRDAVKPLRIIMVWCGSPGARCKGASFQRVRVLVGVLVQRNFIRSNWLDEHRTTPRDNAEHAVGDLDCVVEADRSGFGGRADRGASARYHSLRNRSSNGTPTFRPLASARRSADGDPGAVQSAPEASVRSRLLGPQVCGTTNPPAAEGRDPVIPLTCLELHSAPLRMAEFESHLVGAEQVGLELSLGS